MATSSGFLQGVWDRINAVGATTMSDSESGLVVAVNFPSEVMATQFARHAKNPDIFYDAIRGDVELIQQGTVVLLKNK